MMQQLLHRFKVKGFKVTPSLHRFKIKSLKARIVHRFKIKGFKAVLRIRDVYPES
jgi:hypothetical protein